MTPTAIIDRADFVAFINGCQRPWAEFGWSAATSEGCFFLGEWAFHHAHVNFFNKGLPDLGWEISGRGIIVPAHWQEEVFSRAQILLLTPLWLAICRVMSM